jgi:hypothetical protein
MHKLGAKVSAKFSVKGKFLRRKSTLRNQVLRAESKSSVEAPFVWGSQHRAGKLTKSRGGQALEDSSKSPLFWESGSGWCYHRHETQITGGRSRSEIGGTALA